MRFDGENDRVTVPHASTLDISGVGRDWSVSIWVRIDSPTSTYFVSKNDCISSDGWNFGIDSGRIVIRLNDDPTTNSFNRLTSEVFTDGQWHHVVGMWHAGAGDAASAMEVFVDGNQQVLVPFAGYYGTGGDYNTSGDLLLGTNCYDHDFVGDLDEVRIYDRTLSPAEIRELAGGAVTCADWVSEVGIWGPTTAPCGDLTSTAMTPIYESASYLETFTDLTYEVELVATRPIQPTAANVVFVRGDPTPRGLNSVWDSGYAFGFTTAATGRKFSIFRYSSGRPIVVQSWVAPVPPAVINPSGVANTLKVEANGGTLTFFLNGTPVKTISGQTLLSGQVGVGMVRSMATGASGPKDTLVINAATVTPGGMTRPSKGVSVAQERANEAANRAALTAKPNPLFSDGGRKW